MHNEFVSLFFLLGLIFKVGLRCCHLLQQPPPPPPPPHRLQRRLAHFCGPTLSKTVSAIVDWPSRDYSRRMLFRWFGPKHLFSTIRMAFRVWTIRTRTKVFLTLPCTDLLQVPLSLWPRGFHNKSTSKSFWPMVYPRKNASAAVQVRTMHEKTYVFHRLEPRAPHLR